MVGNASFDEAVAKSFAKKGMKLEEGGCKAAGFSDRVWHKHESNGMDISVWTH
jgi:hypothetical protein